MYFKLEHFSKVLEEILFIDIGSVTYFIPELLNSLSFNSLIELGIVTLSKFSHPKKTSGSSVFKVFGRVIDFNFVQYINALYPIDSIELDIVIFSMS